MAMDYSPLFEMELIVLASSEKKVVKMRFFLYVWDCSQFLKPTNFLYLGKMSKNWIGVICSFSKHKSGIVNYPKHRRENLFQKKFKIMMDKIQLISIQVSLSLYDITGLMFFFLII